MDDELRLTVALVRDGKIANVDQARQILRDANRANRRRQDELRDDKMLVFAAERAFLGDPDDSDEVDAGDKR